jgi:two-component system alkaline phosphatase synthesis response regulator PhoP
MSERNALIIDDEPDMTTYLGAILTDNGWKVRTANSADEGLSLAREQRPDAVLLDMMMPERGGLSVIVELRKDPELEAVPIIVVSGIQETLTEDFRNFLSRFRHRQPDAFLDKPVDPEELMKTLESLAPAAG